MTATPLTPESTGRPATPDRNGAIPSTLWRIGGALALAHVVLMLAAITQEALLEHGASVAEVEDVYGHANLTRVFSAGYVEAMSFLVLTVAIVVIARTMSGHTVVSRLSAQTFLALGIAYVASTLAVGFPPGAAALYGSQHGADAAAVLMVNDIRNYSFVLQIAISCAMTLALAVAALAARIHVRWIGWLGLAVGSVGLVATPFAHDAVSLAWLVWWLGMAVLFLRGAPARD